MIDKDRKALNDRFKKVYKLLEERGVIVKSHPEKSKSAFAEKLLGSRQYGHIITQFLTDRRFIDYKHARILSDKFGISYAYLTEGIGDPFDQPSLQGYSNIPHQDSDFPFENNRGNILFTTVAALASDSLGAHSSDYEQQTYFAFPGLKGDNLVAFYVEGSSMEPIIYPGDMLICQSVSNVKEIRDNEIYAVRHNGQLWIKHVKKLTNKSGHIKSLLLTSANYLDHPPFEEDVNVTTRFYKVVRRVSKLDVN